MLGTAGAQMANQQQQFAQQQALQQQRLDDQVQMKQEYQQQAQYAQQRQDHAQDQAFGAMGGVAEGRIHGFITTFGLSISNARVMKAPSDVPTIMSIYSFLIICSRYSFAFAQSC